MVEPLDFSPSAVLATASAFIGHVALGTLTYNQVHARVQQHHRVRQLSWVIIAATAPVATEANATAASDTVSDSSPTDDP